jgi:hypothetical protein
VTYGTNRKYCSRNCYNDHKKRQQD